MERNWFIILSIFNTFADVCSFVFRSCCLVKTKPLWWTCLPPKHFRKRNNCPRRRTFVCKTNGNKRPSQTFDFWFSSNDLECFWLCFVFWSECCTSVIIANIYLSVRSLSTDALTADDLFDGCLSHDPLWVNEPKRSTNCQLSPEEEAKDARGNV